jgi:DNA-binding response OmpR family regulator
MLTARGDEVDRVLGLELGADDYVTKPFSARELLARIRCVLRRTRPDPAARRDGAESSAPLRINPEDFSLSYFGAHVQLTRGEFTIMQCLTRYPAKVFTRSELVDLMYEGEHAVTDRSIDAHVKRLRRKLGEIRQDVSAIETMHGLGYKLGAALAVY